MGCVSTIGYNKFPNQDHEFCPIGSRVLVCFHYDDSHQIVGEVVRSDSENPFVTIFKLCDGRHVLSTECMFQPIKQE